MEDLFGLFSSWRHCRCFLLSVEGIEKNEKQREKDDFFKN